MVILDEESKWIGRSLSIETARVSNTLQCITETNVTICRRKLESDNYTTFSEGFGGKIASAKVGWIYIAFGVSRGRCRAPLTCQSLPWTCLKFGLIVRWKSVLCAVQGSLAGWRGRRVTWLANVPRDKGRTSGVKHTAIIHTQLSLERKFYQTPLHYGSISSIKDLKYLKM